VRALGNSLSICDLRIPNSELPIPYPKIENPKSKIENT